MTLFPWYCVAVIGTNGEIWKAPEVRGLGADNERLHAIVRELEAIRLQTGATALGA